MTPRPKKGMQPPLGRGCAAGNSDFGLPFPRPSSLFTRHSPRAFTLMEVMIAMGIFFMAIFAILALVSTTLRNARLLQQTDVDASSFAAVLSATNKLYEGRYELDAFPELEEVYKDCTGWADCQSVGTNGLFEVDFTIEHRKGRRGAATTTTLNILLFRPESPTSRFGPTLR